MNEGNSLIPPNRAEDEDSKAEMVGVSLNQSKIMCVYRGFRLKHKSHISVQNWHRGFLKKKSAKNKVTPVGTELTTLV